MPTNLTELLTTIALGLVLLGGAIALGTGARKAAVHQQGGAVQRLQQQLDRLGAD